jgi:hypothetical protein
MGTATFDTFKFVERLEKAGLPREQAAAIAEAQRESLSEALDSTLATKADITSVRSDIVRLENRIETMELRLVIKLGAFFVVAVAALIAVLRLPH